MEHRLLEIGRNHNLNTAEGKLAYYQEAAKVLAQLDSRVERDLYAGRLSDLLKVSKDAILQEVNEARTKKEKRETRYQLPTLLRQEKKELQKVNPQAVDSPRAAAAEENLLGTLIMHPDYIPAIAATLSPEQMVTDFNRQLYTHILQRHRQGLMVELAFLASDYDEAGMAYVTRMVRDVSEQAVTPEEAARFAAIIREEYALRHVQDPATASDDELRQMMETLRNRKK